MIYRIQPKGNYNSLVFSATTGRMLQPPFLSLSCHPDKKKFAKHVSMSNQTVADNICTVITRKSSMYTNKSFDYHTMLMYMTVHLIIHNY